MPTGLNAQCGFKAEAAYGTYLAPTAFLEIESSSMARKDAYLASRPLRGRPGIPVARHRATTRAAEGSIGVEVPSKGFGPILNMMHGETVTPVKVGASLTYQQVHKIGVTAPNNKSLTIQFNKPSVEKDNPFTYIGSKLTAITFSCDTSAQLKAAFDVNARDAVLTEALATASYPDPIRSFGFDQCSISVGGETVTASELIIHSFNLSIPLALKTGRWGLGQGALQLKPIGFNDSMLPTLEFACEFSNLKMYENYTKGEAKEIVITFKGELIETGKFEEISFVLPSAKFVGSDPAISGPDVLDQTASIEIYDNVTNPLTTITYQSVDVTL